MEPKLSGDFKKHILKGMLLILGLTTLLIIVIGLLFFFIPVLIYLIIVGAFGGILLAIYEEYKQSKNQKENDTKIDN